MTTELRPVRKVFVAVSDSTGLAVLAEVIRKWKLSVEAHGPAIAALRELGAAVMEKPITSSENYDLLIVNCMDFMTAQILGGQAPMGVQPPLPEDSESLGLLRKAAGRYDSTCVLCLPADYGRLGEEFAHHGKAATSLEFRRQMAARAFAWSAAYDAAYVDLLSAGDKAVAAPDVRLWVGIKRHDFHGKGAFYANPLALRAGAITLASTVQVQGALWEHDDLVAADIAFAELENAKEGEMNVSVLVSGYDVLTIAQGPTPLEALGALGKNSGENRAVLACGYALDKALAEKIGLLRVTTVIALDADKAARDTLAKDSSLRLLLTRAAPKGKKNAGHLCSISGGFLVSG